MFPKFEIFNEAFYTYPLILGVIWAVGFEYSRALNKNLKHFTILFVVLFVCAWLGAKGLFLITLESSLSDQVSQSKNFWLGGGFVFLGGLIGGLIVVGMHKLLFKQKLSDYEFMLLPLTLGHALGRVGCFLAGCCYGTSCDLPWAIHLHGQDRHPVQLYEAFSLLLLFLILRSRWNKGKSIFVFYLGFYFILRIFIEFFRGDHIRGVYLFGLSTSQIISLCGIVLVLITLALRKVIENSSR